MCSRNAGSPRDAGEHGVLEQSGEDPPDLGDIGVEIGHDDVDGVVSPLANQEDLRARQHDRTLAGRLDQTTERDSVVRIVGDDEDVASG